MIEMALARGGAHRDAPRGGAREKHPSSSSWRWRASSSSARVKEKARPKNDDACLSSSGAVPARNRSPYHPCLGSFLAAGGNPRRNAPMTRRRASYARPGATAGGTFIFQQRSSSRAAHHEIIWPKPTTRGYEIDLVWHPSNRRSSRRASSSADVGDDKSACSIKIWHVSIRDSSRYLSRREEEKSRGSARRENQCRGSGSKKSSGGVSISREAIAHRGPSPSNALESSRALTTSSLIIGRCCPSRSSVMAACALAAGGGWHPRGGTWRAGGVAQGSTSHIYYGVIGASRHLPRSAEGIVDTAPKMLAAHRSGGGGVKSSKRAASWRDAA